jgi:hypothetical protein
MEDRINKLINNLHERQMNAAWFEKKEDAYHWLKEHIPPGSIVGWGDSLTLDAIGIKDYFRSGTFIVQDRDSAGNNIERRNEILRNANFSDYYLVGTNAITENGELVNIDGRGNRCSAISFGPKHVIIVVGINKITSNISVALNRIHEVACVKNAIRHGYNPPCVITGKCTDCKDDECVCANILITRFCRDKGRITVLIINEKLGF